jgi:small-conductance mechanosensitive channel
MSEEENIYDNTDLPNNGKQELTSTEPETKPMAAPELEPGPEDEIISPVTEESGAEEAATEEAMTEQAEQIRLPEVEQSQLRPQTKPKKQTKNMSTTKNQRFLAEASKQIEKQTAQINKINQNLQSLQKKMRSGETQAEVVNQIRSQVNQIQKQISQVQKSIQKGSRPYSTIK